MENKKYRIAKVFGVPMMFIPDRVVSNDIPEGMTRYEVRNGTDNTWIEVGTIIIYSFGGTLLSLKPLQTKPGELTPGGALFKPIKEMEYELTNERLSVEQFIKKYS